MPLEIAIVGAGLVGLGAAIALGRSGHTVDVYEKSKFSHEVGAALHMGAMAQRCLASWDVDLQEIQPVECETLARLSVTADQSKNVQIPMSDLCHSLGINERQLMSHRVDLHQLLLKSARQQPTVTIHLGCGVKAIDPKGSITLEDGTQVSADVIIGADGVHSVAVHAVDDTVNEPEPAMQTMYRFMIPIDVVRQDPTASKALSQWNYTNRCIDHSDFEKARHVVIYPCRNNTILNGVAMMPFSLDPRPEDLANAWNNPGKASDILEVISDFPEEIKALVSLADPVTHWRSVNRECPKTFVRDRLVLVGDSAHPMKPTYGAGAGIGLEDAAALGLLLVKGMEKEGVSEALSQYNQLRYERGVTVKYASEPPEAATSQKLPADTLRELTGGEVPKDMIGYLLGEDPLERVRSVLAA